MERIFAKLLYEIEQNRDTMLVTVVSDQGSTPRGAGSQMLVGKQGRLLGTIGGGAVEFQSEKLALKLLEEKRSDMHCFRLHTNEDEDIGMVCGGMVTVQLRYISGADLEWKTLAGAILNRIAQREQGWLVLPLGESSPALLDGEGVAILGTAVSGAVTPSGWLPAANDGYFCIPLPVGERVFLFGAGHCAQALAPLLHQVGFRVSVIDNRPEYANRDYFPTAESVVVGDYTRLRDYFKFTPADYAVVMTSGHRFDMEIQDQLLRQKMAYVGVIGSRAKRAAVNQRLRERGITDAALATVHSPIGLAIKAVTPEEIAVSIAAEMIYVRAMRTETAKTEIHSCPMHTTDA